MRNRVSIRAIQAFEAAARLGSFTLAAEELAVTPSAVSHQIKNLEEEFGVLLFHRVHRTVTLTEPGRIYAAEIMAAFSRIALATRDVSGASSRAVLTVHSMPSFATQWLMRRLPRFGETQPGLDIRLQASAGAVDLGSGNIDVDIRYNPGAPPPGAVMVAFPDDTILPMCSPALAEGLRPIRRPSDLRHHTLIHSEVTVVGWREWARGRADVDLDIDRGPRFDRSFMAIAAAVDGLGICLDSLMLAEQELRAGKLVVLFPETRMTVLGHGFLTLRSKADNPKVRRFREWLFGELAKTLEWTEGLVKR